MNARLLPLLALALCSAPMVRAHADDPKPPSAPAAPAGGGAEPGYHLAPGPYKVQVSNITLKDAARDKELELRVRSPKLAEGQSPPEGGWPVVVFSHGAGGSRDAFPDLSSHLAGYGYVVVHPTHADSIAQRRRNGQDAPSPLDPDGRAKLRAQVDPAQRVADIKFIADALGEIESKVPGLKDAAGKGQLSRQRLAIAGHSAGALTTQLVAGVRGRGKRISGEALTLKDIGDPRFKAAVVISGMGTNGLIFTEESWSSVAVPMLVITGSLDSSPPQMGNETPQSRQHPFVYSRGRSKGGPAAYLLFIEGATHSSYGGKGVARGLGEQPTTDVDKIQQAVGSATLAFLDYALRADKAAGAYLESDAVKSIIPDKVRWEIK